MQKMKKYYFQPVVEIVKAKGEKLCQTISITGVGNEEPETGDNHFGSGAPFRFKY